MNPARPSYFLFQWWQQLAFKGHWPLGHALCKAFTLIITLNPHGSAVSYNNNNGVQLLLS